MEGVSLFVAAGRLVPQVQKHQYMKERHLVDDHQANFQQAGLQLLLSSPAAFQQEAMLVAYQGLALQLSVSLLRACVPTISLVQHSSPQVL